MKANADQYFTALMKKKKKTDDLLAQKKAAEDAKLKAAEDAKKKQLEAAQLLAAQKAKEESDRLAAQKAKEEADRLAKAKEEADRLQREKEELARQERLRKHIADSLAEVARSVEAASAKLTIKATVKPIIQEIAENMERYDASETYSINIARKSLSAERTRRNKEKGKNLSNKYETFNILTSLLDMVDEDDKKNKNQ